MYEETMKLKTKYQVWNQLKLCREIAEAVVFVELIRQVIQHKLKHNLKISEYRYISG